MWSIYTGQQPYVFSDKDGEPLPNKLFPHFPSIAPPQYTCLAERCLRWDPHERPSFTEITACLQAFFDREVGPRRSAAGPPTAQGGGPAFTSTLVPFPSVPNMSGGDNDGGDDGGMSYCESRSLLASCLLKPHSQPQPAAVAAGPAPAISLITM